MARGAWERPSEDVSVLLKVPQVRLEQAKRAFGVRCIRAFSLQADYPAFLLLHNASRLGDALLGTVKVVRVIRHGVIR